MKVSLIDYTGCGNPDPLYAARVLVFTKNTRLNMTSSNWAFFADMSAAEISDQLAYMADTIPSSWEFVDYTFSIEDVTRACTHQMVRTRTASFAQQSMRVTDMSGFNYMVPNKFSSVESREQHEQYSVYAQTMDYIKQGYQTLIALGASEEDARGILPTNILTNIVGKYNLRTLSDLVKSREGGRTQDEYRGVVKAMGAAVLAAHPWAALFLYPKGRDYWTELENAVAAALPAIKDKAPILKIIDKMRKS